MDSTPYLQYRANFLVPGSRCDVNNQAKASYLLQLMQEMATDHLESLQEGRDALLEQGYIFVLSKVILQLQRPIVSHEALELVTHPHQPVGAQFLRNVDFYAAGELVAQGQAAWLLVDKDTHKIQRPTAWKNPMVQLAPPIAQQPVLQKFPKLDLPVEDTQVRRVRFTDLDCNGHVNNCVYGDMVWDLLPSEMTFYRPWKSLYLVYHRENRLGADLQLTLRHMDNLFLVQGDNDQGKSFEARVQFA